MNADIVLDNASLVLWGAGITLLLSVVSWCLAISVAVLVTLMRITTSRLLRFTGACYVEFMRNIPPIVIIFFTFFALPSLGIQLSAFWAVVIGVGLYGSATMAEVLRSGISAIPRGQYEAAIASGLSFVMAMRLVVLPQAARVVIPPLGSETINLIKNTSLGAAVSAGEILGVANMVGSRTFAYTLCFVVAGIVYVLMTWPAAVAINVLERRYARY